ncbi:LytTR family DNA-binding domain-containing protein [Lewinella sp. 4G2]|uniref:LytR/AlgR family response regulator transcription factor n=1 Tax=Lewinella sp. 4G2 TaxID=1803372 RepID=UPI0007B49361|nr:LytTR family DNA-binding domain-containing protein [Lewinella sp. 4G2]OAV42702.1 DNA-binding response regulator [Lewinella sp. 4G2]
MNKVIIIDDEAAGRSLIREYLADYPKYIPLGEANNGVDAVRLCNEYEPDLIFLDVQMPGLNGFEVLTRLAAIPRVIFSTAYDQYALEAFDVHAVDYLLKPYTKERFSRAMEKLNLERGPNTIAPLAESLLAGPGTYPARILVNKGRKLIPLATADIIWVEADGDYARLHCTEATYHSNYGISAIEEKLDPATFLRVHRSHIVNLSAVREAHRYARSYDLIMRNGDAVRVSRGYVDRVRDLTF